MHTSVLFWRRTDIEGFERLTLSVGAESVTASSTVLCLEDGGRSAHSVTVERWNGRDHRKLTLEHVSGGWEVDGLDLKRCFEFSSIEMTEMKLKHCLDILQICELVKSVRHGKLDYYVAMVEQIPLEIAFRDGTQKADRSTSRWIRRIVDQIAKDPAEAFRIEMFKGRRNG